MKIHRSRNKQGESHSSNQHKIRLKAFFIQSFIIIEQQMFACSPMLENFMLFCGQLQSVSFLATPVMRVQNIEVIQKEISQIMDFMKYISRPDLILVKTNLLDKPLLFEEYAYLLCLIPIIIQVLALFYLYLQHELFRRKDKQSLMERLHKQTFFFKFVLRGISFFLQGLNVYLLIPMTTLCFRSVIIGVEKIDQSEYAYANVILACLSIIFIHMENVARFFFSEESVSMKVNGFSKLSFTSLDFISYVLKTLQCVVYVFINNQPVALYFHTMFILFIATITIWNHVYNLPVCKRSHISIMFLVQGFAVTSALTEAVFINQLTSTVSSIYTIIIIVFPLVSFQLLQTWHRYELSLMLNSLQLRQTKKIHFVLGIIINAQYGPSELETLIINAAIVANHCQKCQDPNCDCRLDMPKISEPTRVNLISDQLQKKLSLLQVKRLNKQISQMKSSVESYSFSVHYISCLNEFGWTTQAFQLSNMILQSQNRLSHTAIAFHNQNLNDEQDEQQQSSSRFNEQQSHQSASQDKSEANDKQVQNEAKILQLQKSHKKNFDKLTIKHHEDLSFIQQQKLLIIQQDIKLKMAFSFLSTIGKSSVNSEDLGHAVNLFLESEKGNRRLKNKVIALLTRKFKFYQLLLNHISLKGPELFKISINLSRKLYNLELELTKLYQIFPSQNIQSVNAFFQAELLNNYLSAYKITNITTIADEKLMKMHQNMKINLFSNKITYMILGLQKNMKTLTINEVSNNAHSFFGYPYETFKNQKNIDFLLPPGIQREHSLLIKSFMSTGKSQYFRNVTLSFFQQKSGFIQPIDLFFDINFSNQNEFSFAVFFQQISTTSAYIIVDIYGNVGGITKNFFEKIGFKQSEIKRINYAASFRHTKIVTIFPKFYEMTQKTDQMRFYGVDLIFLKKQHLIEGKSFQTAETKHISIKTEDSEWRKEQNLVSYQTSLVINRKQIGDMTYQIIEINDLKQQKDQQTARINDNQESQEINNKNMTQNISQNVSQGNLVEEGDWSKAMDISRLDLSEEEASVKFPRAIELVKNDQSFDNESLEFKGFSYVVNRNYIAYHFQKEAKPPLKEQQIDIPILSPNESVSGLMHIQVNKSNQQLNKQEQQQKFFQKINSNELEQSDSEVSDEDIIKGLNDANQIYQMDMAQVDQEMQENIMMQLQIDRDVRQNVVQIDDIGSQVSSIAGVRKSAFYKKYEILNKVIQGIRQSRESKIMSLILSLMFALSSIYAILILVNIDSDLKRFIQEIDMLQIYYGFMGPLDLLWGMKWALLHYNALLASKEITSEQHIRWRDWINPQLTLGYEELKHNFLSQMQNEYLQEFFVDEYYEVLFMNENSSEPLIQERMSFREMLNVMLNYQFAQKVRFAEGSSIQFNPSTVYQAANYQGLHDKLGNMNRNILAYTKNRAEIVTSKWVSIQVPFSIVVWILTILAWLYYKLHVRKFEKIMNLFKYVDPIWIERDIERYKILINILTKDDDIMFKYKFDLELKEKFMLTEKYKKQSNNRKGKETKKQSSSAYNKNKLSIAFSILCLTILFGIFIAYSAYSNIETYSYLNKFQNTAEFFKTTSDLGSHVPGLLLQKEVLINYAVGILPYFNQSNFDGLHNLINLGLSGIDKFQSKILSFNKNDYLTTEEFNDLIQEIQRRPVCEFVDIERDKQIQEFCQEALKGALERGLLFSINYISNNIITERSLNNFTARLSRPILEIEGSYLVGKQISFMSEKMKSGLVEITESHIKVANGLSIAYIIYTSLAVLVLYSVLVPMLNYEYLLVRRFILLMPSSTLLLDDLFDRSLRLLIVTEQLD